MDHDALGLALRVVRGSGGECFLSVFPSHRRRRGAGRCRCRYERHVAVRAPSALRIRYRFASAKAAKTHAVFLASPR